MSHRSRKTAASHETPLSAGPLLGVGFLALSLVFGGAAAAATPADGRTVPLPERHAILPERLKLPRMDGPAFPDDWLPRPR